MQTTLGFPLGLGIITLFLLLPTSNCFVLPTLITVPIQTTASAQVKVVAATTTAETTFLTTPSVAFIANNNYKNQRSRSRSRSRSRMSMSMNVDPAKEKNRDDDDMSDKNNKINSKNKMPIIKNFRKVTGFRNIYRCANTDLLGDLFHDENGTTNDTGVENDNDIDNNDIDNDNIDNDNNDNDNNDNDDVGVNNNHKKSPQDTILNDVGLILDLRSQSERNEKKARKWMSYATGGTFQYQTFDRKRLQNTKTQLERIVYRIDVLSPTRLFDYLSNTWLSTGTYPPSLKAKYMFALAFDSNTLHEIRMDILNEKGLRGLYEAMIETSQEELYASLKAIVEYYENVQQVTQGETKMQKKHGVVIHCVQGKDRTGIISMLCQSMLGISDEIIVADYHLSESLLNRNEGSAAASSAMGTNNKGSNTQQRGKLNKTFFSGSPAEVMVSTLQFIREKYGSVDNYLDSIGFDSLWRERFVKATSIATATSEKDQQYKKKGMEGMNNVLQSKL